MRPVRCDAASAGALPELAARLSIRLHPICALHRSARSRIASAQDKFGCAPSAACGRRGLGDSRGQPAIRGLKHSSSVARCLSHALYAGAGRDDAILARWGPSRPTFSTGLDFPWPGECPRTSRSEKSLPQKIDLKSIPGLPALACCPPPPTAQPDPIRANQTDLWVPLLPPDAGAVAGSFWGHRAALRAQQKRRR